MHKALPFAAWPELALWLCSLHEAPPPSRQAVLDANETRRAQRFVHEVNRRRYLASHVALRERLGQVLGADPASLDLRPDALGKPRVEGDPRCQFNMSDSGDWMLLGMHPDTAIGVDIEELRPVEDALALAERHYTRDEREALDAASGAHARDEVFLRVWTRKEACLKAIGLGLRLPPSSFEAGAQLGPCVAQLRSPQGIVAVEVRSVETGQGTVAAVARVLG